MNLSRPNSGKRRKPDRPTSECGAIQIWFTTRAIPMARQSTRRVGTSGRCFLSLRDLSAVRRLTHTWSTAERSVPLGASRLAACSRRSRQLRTGPLRLSSGAGDLSSSHCCSLLPSRSFSRSGNRVRTPAQAKNAILRPPHEPASSSCGVTLSRVLYQVTRQPLASTRNELPPRPLATKVLSAPCFPGEGRRWRSAVRRPGRRQPGLRSLRQQT